MSKLEQLIYGALFHDIGKLFRKVSGRNNEHRIAGLNEAKRLFHAAGKDLPPVIHDAILYHHKGKFDDALISKKDIADETWIIYEADNIASGLDRREEQEVAEVDSRTKHFFDKEIPLQSVFSLLNDPHGEDISDYKWAYPCDMLGEEDLACDPKILYPFEKAKVKAPEFKYDRIVRKWDSQISNPQNATLLTENPNAMLVLMESLMSFVPSDTYNGRIPDISLYDHLRLTAAIASCMYAYALANKLELRSCGDWDTAETHRQRRQFLLVGGDLSGIQKFIYSISGAGALKNMRARSFYLEILVEHVIDEILSLCGGFCRANIIYSGGGHFYLLLPNTPPILDVLDTTRSSVNQWLWQHFKGSLSMAIAYEPCSAEDLMDAKPSPTDNREGKMRKVWKNLSRQLGEQKGRKYADLSSQDFQTIFEPGDTQFDSDECYFTKVDHNLEKYTVSQEEEARYCNRIAAALHSMGRFLPKTNVIGIERHVDKSLFLSKFDKGVVLLPDLHEPEKDCLLYCFSARHLAPLTLNKDDESQIASWTSTRLYSINRWVLGEHLFANLMVGTYYFNPDDAEKMLTFEELAKQSTGTSKIGVLRADVDDLGTLFTSKLPKAVNTFSRTAALSRQISMFFKLYINQICWGKLNHPELQPFESFSGEVNKETGRPVVIVYSGGDDLFIVGAWNHIIGLAIDIRGCFEKYTGGKLTLSAGVQMFDPHVPVSQMAKQAGEAVKKAKSRKDGEKLVKNSLCLFPNPTVLRREGDKQGGESNLRHRDVYAWGTNSSDDVSTILKQVQSIMTSNFTPLTNGRTVLKPSPKAWLTTSMMYQLYHLADQWSQDNKLSLPRLAYATARLDTRLNDDEEQNRQTAEYKAFERFLYSAAGACGHSSTGMQDFKTLFTWLIYLTREETKHDSNHH